MKVYEFGKEHTRSFAMFQCAVEPWWVFKASAEEMPKDYHNKTMIETGRCEVVQGDVSDLKLLSDAFDLATAFETIYFWPGLEKCFAQVAKVLKPGGYFMICNESDGTDATGLKFEKIIDGMKNHTVEEIEAALRAAVFSEVRSDHHPSKPWITVLARK